MANLTKLANFFKMRHPWRSSFKNPFSCKIKIFILLTNCYTCLLMLFWEFGGKPEDIVPQLTDDLLYSHHLSVWKKKKIYHHFFPREITCSSLNVLFVYRKPSRCSTLWRVFRCLKIYCCLQSPFVLHTPLYKTTSKSSVVSHCGRRGGLMISALESGSSGLGSSHGLGHCVVFLGKILYSHSASLHPGV